MEGFVRLRDVMRCLYSTRESESIRKRLKEIPKYDVKPVRRGTWIESEEKVEDDWGYVTIRSITCSDCGYKESQSSLGGGSLTKSNFCPNCGADLREEEK